MGATSSLLSSLPSCWAQLASTPFGSSSLSTCLAFGLALSCRRRRTSPLKRSRSCTPSGSMGAIRHRHLRSAPQLQPSGEPQSYLSQLVQLPRVLSAVLRRERTDAECVTSKSFVLRPWTHCKEMVRPRPWRVLLRLGQASPAGQVRSQTDEYLREK